MVFQNAPDSLATQATLLLRLNADGPAKEIAWSEFYGRYAPIIAGFARKMGAKSGDISDVVQDVMLGFFATSPRFFYDPSRGRFRGYLKTCVWRVLQARMTKEFRFGGRTLSEIDPDDIQVESTWNDVWENEKLQRAVEMVRARYLSRPDKSRTFRAFEMFALLDASAEEVASELEMSVDSVHQAKSRVSKAIKAAMDELDGVTG